MASDISMLALSWLRLVPSGLSLVGQEGLGDFRDVEPRKRDADCAPTRRLHCGGLS